MAAPQGIGRDPMLSGIYEPVADELDIAELRVEGEIPRGLRGTYLRNGGNPKFDPRGRFHLFDGDGMLHGVEFLDGRASYRNRWVRTPALAIEEREGHAIFGGMANPQPVPDAIRKEVGAGSKNAANTHVIRHADRILCLWEAGLPTEVRPDLSTVGQWDFDGRLSGPMTAHPKLDPETGEMLFFGYSGIPPYLRFHVVDADGKLVRSIDIDLPAPVMMHDFVTTRENVVFLDGPAVFDFASFSKGESLLQWKPENGTRIGVMPREGDAGDMRWFEIENSYCFHFLNAYDDGGKVVIDGCRNSRMDIGLDSDSEMAAPNTQPYLTRFTVDLDAGHAGLERIAERPGDFPRLPDSLAGLPNRYGYVPTYVDGELGGGGFDAIFKYDLDGGSVEKHCFGADKVVGEAVFAPDPEGSAEDDGWLVTYVSDRDGASTELVMLDARDVAAAPVATLELPRRVPFGFHGSWLPEEG